MIDVAINEIGHITRINVLFSLEMDRNKSALQVLKTFWGFESFREGQEEIVFNLTQGRDVLAILPTGGGKSICYQVPGLAMGGLTLVISPLIALMQDQVDNLKRRGIRAEALSAGMAYKQIDRILDNARFGGLDFLYVSPERVQTSLFKERFKHMSLSLIAVDEAHCISEWGHDFRPSYRQLTGLRTEQPKVPMIALTATATERVARDIQQQLQLKDLFYFRGNIERSNLITKVEYAENKIDKALTYCTHYGQKSGIVYCQTRKMVKHVYRLFSAEGLSIGMYHGGMSAEERSLSLDRWLKGDCLIMVATNAFGMGIDKPDVRFVLHVEVPAQLEAYLQEAGRAGRDGKEAFATAFWNNTDIQLMQKRTADLFPDKKVVSHVFQVLCEHLRVAYSSGQFETYSLDYNAFCSSRKLDQSEVYHALKLLEMNGNISFSDGIHRPTRILFRADHASLYRFQVAHPALGALTQFLLRSYPGIHEHSQRIHESEIAKRFQCSVDQIKKQLEQLQQYELIEIEWGSDQPQVMFLLPRPAGTEIALNPEIYSHRKELAGIRLNTMLDFLTTETCRMRIAQRFFGQNEKDCGNCDRCMEKIKSNSPVNVDVLRRLHSPKSLDTLAQEMGMEAKALRVVLRFMLLEEKIEVKNGLFCLRE
jgi:ATP-dependent DNA helicase RecQ